MGCCRIFVIIAAVFAAWLGYKAHTILYNIPEVPNLPNVWWGPNVSPDKGDTSIKSFKVEFQEKTIEDLKDRLNKARFYTDPLVDIGFQYGFNNKYLEQVVDFWQYKYNFTEREAYLNQYPHFKTNIQGLDIHFVHVKPKITDGLQVYPLLLLHGWPGSFIEFYKLIPLLTTPRKEINYVFELIIPSLPGYGFSQGTSKTGMGVAQISVIMKNFMDRLGYNKYIIQGGDWGAVITSHMAVLYPDKIYGYHTNMPFVQSFIGTLQVILGSIYPPMVIEKEHQSKLYPFLDKFTYLLEESGYMHLQATKPDTIGVALRDSPVGLAAYILEKFSTWTNSEWKKLNDGGLTKKYTLTELLDNIMIYWVSDSITTSMRLYSESFNKNQMLLNLEKIPLIVPTAVTRCAHEISYTTVMQLNLKYKELVQITDYPNCGHFLAFEEPQLLANDIWSSVIEYRKFYLNKIVKNGQ